MEEHTVAESEEWPTGRPDDRVSRARDAHDRRTGSAAAAERIRQQTTWVDLQVKQAMQRGDFDDLPGTGKPIEDLERDPDPDWWLKQLIAREQITGVLPASLQLRKDDAELDARLDEIVSEKAAREVVEEFNERVIAARYSLPEGPPLITMPRDVEATLAAWRERLAVRRAAHQPAHEPRRRRWFRRRSRRTRRADQ